MGLQSIDTQPEYTYGSYHRYPSQWHAILALFSEGFGAAFGDGEEEP